MLETLKFEIDLHTAYQKTPPYITISVNDNIKFNEKLLERKVIAFEHTLNKENMLIIHRQNKPENSKQDLFINSIKIDGIDLRNLIWSKSIFTHTDGREVVGETWLGLNGTWRLKFNGPFWQFMMDWVNGKV